MAAPMDRKPVEGKTTKLPPEIDLTSPRFDATKALFSRQILLPFASAQPLDNLAKFESWSKQSKKNEDISKNLQIEPARKQIQRPIPAVSLRRKTEQQSTSADLSKQSGRHRNKLNRNVLTRMDAYIKGPLSFLKECVENRHVVKIWTRGACELRGFCTGYLVAFDKYFNLAMMDVDETYRKPVSRDNRLPQCTQMVQLKPTPNQEKTDSTGRDGTEKSLTSQESSIKASVESNVNAMENLKITNTEKSKETSDRNSVCTPVKSCASSAASDCGHVSQTHKPQEMCSTTEQNKNIAGDRDVNELLTDISDRQNDDSRSNTRTNNTDGCSTERKTHIEKDKTLSAFDAAKVAKVWQEAVARDKTKPPLKLKHRHANQLFIRGDNVVSVSLVYK